MFILNSYFLLKAPAYMCRLSIIPLVLFFYIDRILRLYDIIYITFTNRHFFFPLQFVI